MDNRQRIHSLRHDRRPDSEVARFVCDEMFLHNLDHLPTLSNFAIRLKTGRSKALLFVTALRIISS